jgi:hypothetical protein
MNLPATNFEFFNNMKKKIEKKNKILFCFIFLNFFKIFLKFFLSSVIKITDLLN